MHIALIGILDSLLVSQLYRGKRREKGKADDWETLKRQSKGAHPGVIARYSVSGLLTGRLRSMPTRVPHKRRNKSHFNCGELNRQQLPLKLHDTYRATEILHCGSLYYFAAGSSRLRSYAFHCEPNMMLTDSSRPPAQAFSLAVHRCTPIGHAVGFIRSNARCRGSASPLHLPYRETSEERGRGRTNFCPYIL